MSRTGGLPGPRPALPILLVLLLFGLLLPRGATRRGGGNASGVARSGTAAADATPGDAPPPPVTGPFSFLKRAWTVFSEDRIMSEAGGVTFYVLLALFPGLASLISIYGLFGNPAELDRQLHGFGPMIPGGGMEILDNQIRALASSSGGALGFGVLAGLLTSLWSANNGIKSLFEALNVVYREKERRSFVRFTLTAFAFTLGGIAFLIIAVSAVVALPVMLNFVGLENEAGAVLSLLRWPILLAVLMVGLSTTYRYGPSHNQAHWQWVSWGGVVAALGWLAVSFGFSFYVAHFGTYNKTYGSLGAVIGFMTWIWISAMVVLMGGALNAELAFARQRREQGREARPVAPQEAVA